MTTSKNQDLKKHIQSIMEVIKKNVIQGYKIFIVFPFYVLTHPIDGFYELKEGKKGLYKVATLFFLIHSILSVVEFAYTGFIFNNIKKYIELRRVYVYMLFFSFDFVKFFDSSYLFIIKKHNFFY